jgi:hypothetical protein
MRSERLLFVALDTVSIAVLTSVAIVLTVFWLPIALLQACHFCSNAPAIHESRKAA